MSGNGSSGDRGSGHGSGSNHGTGSSHRSGSWYGDGLRFACTGCGRCCTGSDGYVWVTREEICALAERFGISLDQFGKRFLRRVGARYALVDGPHGDCVFLVGKVCSVYEDRPSQCRAFPWWPANLESRGAWLAAAETCEGISDDAPIVPFGEIESLRRSSQNAGPPDATPLRGTRSTTDPVADSPIDSKGRPSHVAKP
jgi:Fe-S-cluster containining protein